jgi:RNA polymerase sigma-70 factor (ECF subfamily)
MHPVTANARPAAEPGETGGPPPALADVYRDHYDFVWRTTRRMGVYPDAIEDAVHDVFVIVARRLHEFRGRSELRTWLFAITLRVVQHHRRAYQRHRRRVEAMALATGRAVDAGQQSQADARHRLHHLLDGLDDDRRAVYVLVELERLTAPEAATMLEIPVRRVHTLVRLARRQLEKAVGRVRAAEERERR